MSHASRVLARTSRRKAVSRAPRSSTRCRAQGSRARPSQINYGAAKAGIAAMTIIASLELGPLRRAGQLHRPRRLHPHGRPGHEGHRDQEPRGVRRVRPHEPGQLRPRGGVARVRRVEAGDRPGAADGRQLASASTSAGRWARSSSPPTRRATRRSGTRPTSAGSSAATTFRHRQPGHRRAATAVASPSMTVRPGVRDPGVRGARRRRVRHPEPARAA